MADNLVDLLKRLAAARRGSGAPERHSFVVGLIGRGIQSSRTPSMHEREARRLGIDYSYILLDFDNLNLPDSAAIDVTNAAQAAGFQGLNVTHPFKQAVMPLLTELSDAAAAIGAVNTIVFTANGKRGHNTDAWGFAESFRDTMGDARRNKVTIFGAGGAGAAVAYALGNLGVQERIVVDVVATRASDLAERIAPYSTGRVTAETDIASALAASDGIVNTTPVGMAKYPGTPFDAALLSPDTWVADIIYFPTDTALLRAARAIGCRTFAGAGMAIGQAVRAFELFTGVKADRRAMADHFEAAAESHTEDSTGPQRQPAWSIASTHS